MPAVIKDLFEGIFRGPGWIVGFLGDFVEPYLEPLPSQVFDLFGIEISPDAKLLDFLPLCIDFFAQLLFLG